ncbi:MAG TPA: hemerythrin domain-containing protein [Jatrophihabitantaceae bacterium]|nr:hemerythrin domain-containing protein [Jatrophihabitantaceae bacterium]
MTESSTQQTIIEVLASDHDGIAEQLADPVLLEAEDAGGTARTELVMDLVRHFVAEERYLYPSLRTDVDGGAALADDDFAASRACEKELRRLEARDVDATELAAVLADVRRRFADHVSHQRDVLFPRLDAVLDRVRLLELGEQALGAEQLAPTRPRVLAPEALGANQLAGLVEGFVDRLRDFYTGRGTR